MTTIDEGRLRFSLPDGLTARRFDGSGHGLAHCMKAVDFLVELPTRTLFVEVKDPAHPAATEQARRDFLASMRSRQLIAQLVTKFRDSLHYRLAEGPLRREVLYVVLLELPHTVDPGIRLVLTDELRRMLPTVGVPPSWTRPLAADAMLLDIAQWNALGRLGTVTARSS